eukprot:10781_1
MCSSYTHKYKDAISQNDLSQDVSAYKEIDESNKQLQTQHRHSISKSHDTEDGSVKEKDEKSFEETKKEYLHLTATVINIKYPQIEHISPVDLINRVEHCNFWEYYDKMQKIMENEINKM